MFPYSPSSEIGSFMPTATIPRSIYWCQGPCGGENALILIQLRGILLKQTIQNLFNINIDVSLQALKSILYYSVLWEQVQDNDLKQKLVQYYKEKYRRTL